jgi:hypothetical protein
MRCEKCSSELQPGSTQCSRCGAPRRATPPAFLEVEKRFSALRSQFQKGDIDFAAFQQACQELVLKDAAGAAWRYNIADREWYLWQKDQWVRSEPAPASPAATAHRQAARVITPPTPPRIAPPPSQTSKKRRWLVIGCGSIVIVGVIAVIILAASGVLTGFIQLPFLNLPGSNTPVNDSGVVDTPQTISALEGKDISKQFKPASTQGAQGSASESGYCIALTQPGSIFFEPSQQSAPSLAIDAMAELVKGPSSTEYGLLVRASDVEGNGGIVLTINGSGQWRVQSLAATGAAELHGWSDSPELVQGAGANRLSVLVEGESLYFIANGKVLWERHDLSAGGAVWGVFASTASESGGEVCITALRAEIVSASPPDDRESFLAEFGQPDTFILLFEEAEDGSLVRREEWIYNDELTTLTFLDGVLANDEAIEPSQTLLFGPADLYHPLDFQPGMSIEQVKALLGNPELAEIEVLPELGGNYRLYGAKQIMLGFSDDKLVYVETLALTAAEEVAP